LVLKEGICRVNLFARSEAGEQAGESTSETMEFINPRRGAANALLSSPAI